MGAEVYHPSMRTVALLLLAACGGPALANAPHPNNAAMAGGAAAAAAAMTLADPDAASRKPEKKEQEEKKPVDVKETVPSDVLDRADRQPATETKPTAEPAARKKKAGPPPKLPSPRDAASATEHDHDQP
jgi:hypothetical protein